jgi:hypothetical protein
MPDMYSSLAHAVDCIVSAWLDVGICTKSCGGGKQAQTRTVLTAALGLGTACPVLSQQLDCNMQACPGKDFDWIEIFCLQRHIDGVHIHFGSAGPHASQYSIGG